MFRLSLSVAAVVAAALLAGCGASPAPVSAPAGTTGSSAPASSAPASSAPAAGQEISAEEFAALSGKGMSSLTSYTYTATMNGATGDTTMKGSVDNADPSSPNLHTVMTVAGKNTEILKVGDSFFMLGLMGDGWVKMPQKLAEQAGGNADPSSMINQVKDLIEKVVVVGPEDVNGTATTHYRVTLDPKALERLSGEAGAVEGEIGYDSWLDADGIARRTVMDIKAGSASFAMTMELVTINEPVTIKAPEKYTEMPG